MPNTDQPERLGRAQVKQGGTKQVAPFPYIDISRYMEKNEALDAFAALAQQTRLDVFQLLVRYEPGGLPAGEIADQLNIPQNTLSTHLAILTRAGLTTSERRSRSIIYRASTGRIHDITRFLVAQCCDGQPDKCFNPAFCCKSQDPEKHT